MSTVTGGADAVCLGLGSATRNARRDAFCVRTAASKSGARRAARKATKVAAKRAARSRVIRALEELEVMEVMEAMTSGAVEGRVIRVLEEVEVMEAMEATEATAREFCGGRICDVAPELAPSFILTSAAKGGSHLYGGKISTVNI